MKRMTQIQCKKLALGHAVPKAQYLMRQNNLPHLLRAHIKVLGPRPKPSLETLVDLGLSDREIANYFHVPQTSISKLCDIWNIHR